MPYSPGISYDQGRPIGQGISTAIGRWLEFAGMLKNEADQTTALRKQLSTLEPAKEDSFSKMTRAELQGYAGATAMKTQQAQAALDMMLKQQNLQNAQATGAANAGMSNAMRQALTGGTGTNPMAPGQPGAPGDATGGADPSGLIKAMMANPESVNTPAGRSALSEWMRQTGQRPDANGVVSWNLGDMSGGIETRTGKLFFDPTTERRIAEARRKPMEQPVATPDEPAVSKDGRFYLDTQSKVWKPIPGATKRQGLFDEPAQGANPYKNQADVVTDYKAGKLSWEDAAKLLRENFGVK